MSDATSTKPAAPASNPLLGAFPAPFGVPPFEAIEPRHFEPAFATALAAHAAEIEAIKSAPGPATFANTIDALEEAGETLGRVARVFYNLAGSHTSPELQAVERTMAPRMAKHWSAISLDPQLFKRVDEVWQKRETFGLSAEQSRVLERTHTGFVRSGANLGEAAKARIAEINTRLATLGTSFAQNVLAEEQAFRLVLDGERDLAGLPEFARQAAAQTARDLGLEGRHVITLSRSSIEPFLQFAERRDLRETAFKAWIKRGENGGSHDNRAIALETLKLRAERAKLLGFASFAAFRLDDAMAKSTEAVRALLDEVWTAAVAKAGDERKRLASVASASGQNIDIEGWDWRFWTEKVRKAEHDLDEAEIKPFMQLDRMIEAAFDTAGRLFGLTFEERQDIPRYHPDVRTFEVKDGHGRHVGLFLGDYFARPSKRSGAWMSAFRGQRRLGHEERPIIVNVLNLTKGGNGQPTLLSFDDARTLFHEFGHALHGLLSDVTYPSLAGTAVSTDFVELPSQLYEHWLATPEVLSRFARHYQTNEPIPADLVRRLKDAQTFNQGFATCEYVASALADLELHSLDNLDGLDLGRFESELLDRRHMPQGVVMRHRLPHFAHVFSGGGYASAYYSYMWSEVLDADAFDAFVETGNVFDPETARRLKTYVYSAGNLRDPRDAYVAFRGRLPSNASLLKKRGLAA